MSFVTGRQTYRAFVNDPILAALVSKLDTIPQALAADRQAEALLAEASEPARSLDADIADIVAAGTVDADRIATLAGSHARAGALESERAVLLEIRARATSALESGVTNAAPQLLTALHGHLTDLTDQARPNVETLADVATPGDAIEAGPEHVEAWSALAGHRKRYDQLRTSQSIIMSSTDSSRWNSATRIGNDLPSSANDAHVANLDELWPSWRATKGANDTGARTDPAGYILRESISGRRMNTAPWPDEPVAEFAWLVAHAELWIPTPKQLDKLWDERIDRDNELRAELTNDQQSGRGRAQGERISMAFHGI